jgi:hypothetical protein
LADSDAYEDHVGEAVLGQRRAPFDWRLREDTELGLLVHDETKHTDIMDIRAEEVDAAPDRCRTAGLER